MSDNTLVEKVYNITTSGNLTRETSTIFSNFSSDNYFIMANRVNSNGYLELSTPAKTKDCSPIALADSWEINVKVRFNSGITHTCMLIGCYSTNISAPQIYLGGSAQKIGADLNLASGSWTTIETDFSPNTDDTTWYWVRLSYDNQTGYKLEVSTDGETYETIGTSSNTTKLYRCYTIKFGGDDDGSNYFRGGIDLSGCNVKLNGQLWWEPIKEFSYEKINLYTTV